MEAEPMSAPAADAGAGQAPEPTGPDLDRIEAELAAVEQALADLDSGTYGTCQVCGSALDGKLLESTPTAVRCRAHA